MAAGMGVGVVVAAVIGALVLLPLAGKRAENAAEDAR